MKRKALDSSHLLVILNAEETRSFGLLQRTPLCRLAVAKIFAAACGDTGFAEGKKRISLKILRTADGECVLLFSAGPLHGNGGRKLYRLSSPQTPWLYRFDSAEDLMSALERLCREKLSCGENLLFLYKGGYRLALSPPLLRRCRLDALLREYGRPCGRGKPSEAFFLEHGVLLSRNPVRELGSRLL